ncbi:hypothetical protein A2870_02320 [Candidatus Curtissbacteria bacterium RIFCSPHIGHO2_01_FULL_41_11]|uniref:Transcriptional repressor PaaX-like central Cas2-like domain-containing protein n=1 Tax=Candidatus Curtissbacteria bacterium RIFCSPHIGHO2_01_FULL_41_11 TaxID=1797711 RepID=A0A1F5G4I2_9BACT|nr:MAG: hypothetical protein A2870_02320 [Candidatus Curtissbacteria bacterium RIFCSPHIGHO2_01_FULL_41_11]
MEKLEVGKDLNFKLTLLHPIGYYSVMVKNRLKDAILLALEKSIDGAVMFAEFYENPRRFVWYGPDYFNKSALSTSLSRLRKKGMVEKIVDGEKVILRLTEAGRDWVLKNKGEDDLNWDGFWRFVIFDIPEKHRKIRSALRLKLKEWGFAPWQKSVWATKKPLTEQIRQLVRDLKVEEWVLVIESDNVGKSHLLVRSARKV